MRNTGPRSYPHLSYCHVSRETFFTLFTSPLPLQKKREKNDLCIDLLSQLAAEQWFGFPELQMALTRAAFWPSLVIMRIKYDMPIDLDEVVSLFEGLHPRMMQLQRLLYEAE